MNGTENILKQFQLDRSTIAEKSKPEIGLAIAKEINNTYNSGFSGYYAARNTRFQLNRLSANGRENMQKFMDFLDFNGKFNYANLNWQSIKIVNRICTGMVGRGMAKKEKVVVQATDPLSVKEKDRQYEEVEFMVYNRDMLEQLHQASGVPMIPQGQDLPESIDELALFKALQRLPEEIFYEIGINDVMAANGFFDVLKERLLRDSTEVGLLGTYTWMDQEGVIHIEWVRPENMIYSWSEYDDFRDTTWRGQIKSMKISEIRKKYGKEFGGKLTEEQLWGIASRAKNYQLTDKIRYWNAEWSVSFMRPYDDWNVDVFDFEIKTVDSEKYTITETRQNKSTILQKGAPNKKIKDNQKILEDSHWNIYKGVHIRDTDIILEWGLKKNMIRPQDPKEIGNAEFSYSFFMYQNYQMRNVAIPEKIQEPSEQMILARLKMQQLVAKMIPTGAAIDLDAMQELDYGLGNENKLVDWEKLYTQTGRLYYRGKDAEGNRLPVPIQELANSGFLGQMQGLIELYRFHYEVLKDELGEDPALISQALQPRVTGENVMTAQRVAENATGYMYDAYKYVLEDTAKKVACLLQKSVLFGAKVYRSILKEEQIENRIFGTKMELLPTDQDIAILNEKMNYAIASNPDLAIYLDTYKVIRIARENVKLADLYYNNAMKKMRLSQMQQAQQNAEMNAQAQQQAVVAKGEMDMQIKQLEAQSKNEEIRLQGESQNKTAVINMVSSLIGKGAPIPANLQPLVNTVVENMMLPLAVQNEKQKAAIIEQMQMAEVQQQEEMKGEGGVEQGLSEDQLQEYDTMGAPEFEMQEQQILEPA